MEPIRIIIFVMDGSFQPNNMGLLLINEYDQQIGRAKQQQQKKKQYAVLKATLTF